MQRQRPWQRQWGHRQRVQDQQGGVEACEVWQQLEQWVDVYPLCRWRGLAEHTVWECGQDEAVSVHKAGGDERKYELFEEFSYCVVWSAAGDIREMASDGRRFPRAGVSTKGR